MKQTYIWQKKVSGTENCSHPKEKAKYLRALKANADSATVIGYGLHKNFPNITQNFLIKYLIFRVYAHNKSNWCTLVIT